MSTNQNSPEEEDLLPPDKQRCPVCNELIGSLAGSKDAICQNCGFKDPCCE